MPTTPLPIPETKPATEFIDGRLVQKMSPFGMHARVQAAVAVALTAWSDAKGRGRVGTEWDFDLTPSDGGSCRLVPDVAFLSYDRVGFDDEAAAQVPTVAPNVVVEILSEGQTLDNTRRRVRIFLDCGAEVVILVDPRAEEAWLVDPVATVHLMRDGTIEHDALPEFSMPLVRCFEKVPPGGRR